MSGLEILLCTIGVATAINLGMVLLLLAIPTKSIQVDGKVDNEECTQD